MNCGPNGTCSIVASADATGGFWTSLFDTSNFPPRWRCGTWSSELGWLHIASDVAIFLAYTAIPVALGLYMCRRKDVPFPRIGWLFAAFILSCGFGHLVEAIIFWFPIYRFAGVLKAVTAVVSWVTVIALVRLLPEAMKLPGIARLNQELAAEIAERQKAQEELRAYSERLEGTHSQLEAKAVELTRTSERLREAQIQAERANMAKSRFLANMSHEIRTPMTAVLGFAEALDKGIPNSPEWASQRESLAIVHRNGQYLLDLINSILDLSKIESGQLTIERIPCSTQSLIEEAVLTMRGRAEARGLRFEVRRESPLPETIITDPTRLRQILTNLIGNAVKFTEHGYIRISVSLDQQQMAPRLRFIVADSGIGMTAQQLERLFQPFIQADASTTRRFGGTGLGLSICKHLVEMLGGEITARSEPQVGSAFEFTLPTGPLDDVRLVEFDNPAAPFISSRPDAPEIRLEGLRILVAEDGIDNQRLLSFFLKKAGAEVVLVEDGQRAVEMMRTEAFDVLLTDIQMPIMDGYETVRILRNEGFDLPIIALTANAMRGDRELCLAAGCDDYAAKPFQRFELISKIADWSRRRDRSAYSLADSCSSLN